MKRALPIAVALAVLAALPATSSAAAWRGTIVAKERSRGTVVTVSPSGLVHTLRAPARVQKLRVGQRIAVRARPLADGTFKAQAIRVVGRAAHARIRATVVRQKAAGRLVVSAGGSTFVLRSRSARRVSSTADNGLDPGDRIVADVSIHEEEVDVEDVSEVGTTDLLELSGTFASFTAPTLVINAGGGTISISVPATMTLPPLSLGDEVELLVSVGAGNAFTLAAIKSEGADDQGDEGDHGDQGSQDDEGVDLNDDGQEVEVKGVVAPGVAGTIVVQPGDHAAPVVCTIPAGMTVGVTVNQFVEMKCELVNGTLTLKEVEAEDDQGDDENEVESDANDESGPGSVEESSDEDSDSGSGESSGSGGEVDD